MRCIILFAFAFPANHAAARQYVVRGVEDPRPDLLARSLANDDGLLLLTSPLTTRKAYLSAVSERVTHALERAGYPDAKANTALDHGPEGDRVVVDVVPGPRYMAHAIEITGMPDDLAADLRSWLKSQRPPPDAVPQAVDSVDGWSGIRWVDRRGQASVLEQPLWRRGQPAAFDPRHLRDVRDAIARFLRDHGHLAAARAIEKPQATGPRCDVTVRRGDAGAELTIAFADLPPPVILQEIEVAPASRTTAATLCDLLGIAVGATVTEHDRLAWREALRESGRFIRHEVRFRELKPGPEGAAGVVAIFDLAAYPPVPPLGQPLSREEQTILRCRSWLLRTLADDDDLVATWSRAADQPAVGAVTISTREGILLTACPGADEACGIAASGGGLACFLPRAGGRWEFPLPVRMRAVLDATFTLDEIVERGKHRYVRNVAYGFSLTPRPREAPSAVALSARIEPVACLALLHDASARATWDGETLVIDGPNAGVRIDASSGRLLEMRLGDGGRIEFASGAGRLADSVTTMRATSGADAWCEDAPVSSTIRFLTGPHLAAAVDRLAEAAGVRAWLAESLPIVTAVARNLRETSDRGGFAVADRQAAAALAQAAVDDGSALPLIPVTDRAASPADPLMAVAAAGAAQAWRWLDRICGDTSWPSGLVRIATHAARHDSTGALWEVTSFMATPTHGPIAHLVAASAIPMQPIAVSFARQGQSRLSTAAFHADCDAVLAVLRDCGLDRGIVALVRSLDDDEARAAGAAWLHDPDALLPLVRDLRTCESEEAAIASLPSALDRWWDASLRDVVAAALVAKTAVQTADKPDAEPTPRR